ncbi:unnamed protein product [Triticum turgidum subsp. durum]|uniref:Uncharacterized protein n=1 Tax=Triticum turgidum subsp. durum TaxID=4567 RepID=A0A9R0WZJ1_TRITD|nr:unnamed protein product [Triticum turgidum subsp. durum]
MASPPPQVDVDLGKLSYEIFSFLESKFLYGGGGGAGGGGVCSLPGTPGRGPLGGGGARVRVLAIDGCGPGPGDALLAAAALARLEAALRAKAGDPDARVADFFDAATPSAGWRTPIPPRSPSPAEMVRLTAEGVADMVDQAVAMAFGHTCGRNYVRIQAAAPAHSIKALRSLEARKVVAIADGMLTQRNVEAELFRGRRLSEKSNREKLDAFATELVKEHDRRRDSPPGLLPNVAIKQVSPTPPRLSSATTSSAATTGTTGRTASTMPSPASTQDSRH